MASMGVEILSMALSVLGWISAVVSCVLPQWKVTALVGMKVFSTEMTGEGIWMTCLYQRSGQVNCKPYDSILALSASLQAARALTVVSIVVGTLGLLMATVGARCTNCVDGQAAKARALTAAGGALVSAGFAQVIPVSWFAYSVVVDFNDPGTPEEKKKEMGAALYLGWVAAALLLIGGSILCSSCSRPPRNRSDSRPMNIYPQNKSTDPSNRGRHDYV